MTYREEIQELIRQLWLSYDKGGYLRDCAAPDEKEAWNSFRGGVHDTVMHIIKLDNRLPPGRAEMEV